MPHLPNAERCYVRRPTRAIGRSTEAQRKRTCNVAGIAPTIASQAEPRHILEHIDRLRALRALELPVGIERLIHQNLLLKLGREGGQMTCRFDEIALGNA
jgi:hypothetical protein